MAVRKQLLWDERTRQKIKATQIINRIQDFILNDPEGIVNEKTGKVRNKAKFKPMSSAQVNAALGLLRKVMPDLATVEANFEGEIVSRVINAEPMSDEQWEKEYCGDLEPAEGTAESAD